MEPPVGASVSVTTFVAVCPITVIGGAGRVAEAQGADERVDAGADGRVADAELALHLLEVAPRSEEALEERQLLAVEAAEAARTELALEGRAAAAAVQARDRQLTTAHRAGGDDVVNHRQRPRADALGLPLVRAQVVRLPGSLGVGRGTRLAPVLDADWRIDEAMFDHRCLQGPFLVRVMSGPA